MKKASATFVFLILWATLLFAQVKFTATASKTSVCIGERFEVVFSVNTKTNQFTPPDLSTFPVMFNGPNESTSETVDNGDTISNTIYSYILVAKKEGTFDIGAAAVGVGAERISSNILKIKVQGQFSADQPQKIALPASATEEIFKSPPIDVKTLPKQIFIRAEVDKTHAYVGEQIKVIYKLYTCIAMENGQLNKVHQLKGFRNVVVNLDGREIPWTIETVNGIRYHAGIIRKLVVSPEHAGNFTIAPLTMTTILRVPENKVFDSLLKYEIKSAPIIIHAIAPKSK